MTDEGGTNAEIRAQVQFLKEELYGHIRMSDENTKDNNTFHSDTNARVAVLERMMIQLNDETRKQTEQLTKISEAISAQTTSYAGFKSKTGVVTAILAVVGSAIISSAISVTIATLLQH